MHQCIIGGGVPVVRSDEVTICVLRFRVNSRRGLELKIRAFLIYAQPPFESTSSLPVSLRTTPEARIVASSALSLAGTALQPPLPPASDLSGLPHVQCSIPGLHLSLVGSKSLRDALVYIPGRVTEALTARRFKLMVMEEAPPNTIYTKACLIRASC